jgi:hypothetical protein
MNTNERYEMEVVLYGIGLPVDESWTNEEIRYSFDKFVQAKRRGEFPWVDLPWWVQIDGGRQ